MNYSEKKPFCIHLSENQTITHKLYGCWRQIKDHFEKIKKGQSVINQQQKTKVTKQNM